MEQGQTTDAQLSDGTTLRFQGQLSPDEVKAKVAAYRSKQSGSGPVSGGVTEGHNVTPQPEGFWHSAGSVLGVTPEQLQATGQDMKDHPVMSALETSMPLIGMLKGTAQTAPPLAKKTAQEASSTVQSVKQGQYGDAAAHAAGTLGYGAATAVSPLFGDSLSKAGEQLGTGNVAGGLGTTAGILAPMAAAKVVSSPTSKALFQSDLAGTSHDILNKGAADVKSKLWDAHNQVSQRVGQLKNDIAAADYQSGKPQIPTADIQAKVLDLTDKYRASDSNTPAFSTAAKRIADLPANLSFKDLADLKSEIGTKWSKTPDGTPDSAAINELRSHIDQNLAQRADDLGRTKQYGAYNKLWSTLMGYESDGVMGKLLNADNGAKFMDVLRDPANKAELARTVDSLQNFGLDPDTLSQFQKSHAPLHDYVSNGNMVSKMRLILNHPLTAIPGMAIGGAIGSAIPVPGASFLGGTGGAVASSRLASRISAANAVGKLGIPSLTGEMADAAAVRPVGSGERPTPPPSLSGQSVKMPDGGNSTAGIAQQAIQDAMNKPKAPEYGGEVAKTPESSVDLNEIVKVLSDKKTGLGYDKAEAVRRAKMAAAAVPNDQSEALNYAIRGGPDKAAGINTVKNTATNSPDAAAAANDQAAQKIFGRPYDSLSVAEKMKVFSEGAKIQDQARAQTPQAGSGEWHRPGGSVSKQTIADRIDEAKKRKK
jgi:hypothetical protein